MQLGVLLNPSNGARRGRTVQGVDLLMLERTLIDPPRAKAAGTWAAELRRSFPGAQLLPYLWHLISHMPDEGLREQGSRSLEGPASAFGGLQPTPQNEQAWDSMRPCIAALGAEAIVVRTAVSVAPGPVGKKRLTAFIEARRAEQVRVVWEPEGVWEPRDAVAFGTTVQTHVLTRAFSAGRPNYASEGSDLIGPPQSWLRVDGLPGRPRLNPDQLAALATHAETTPDAVIVFAGPMALANLAALAAEFA